MTMFKLLGSAAILSAFIATPALAQHMIDEPGLFAFYHPNGDLGIGSTRPANASRNRAERGSLARVASSATNTSTPTRPITPRSTT